MRQLAVRDDEVVGSLGGAEQAFAAIRRDVDDVAALAQALGEETRGLRVVFDEQQVHLTRQVSMPSAVPALTKS